MQYRKLGSLGKVSTVALGTWQFSGSGTWGEIDDKVAVKTVHKALDGGINLIDTAEKYGAGHSEQVLGKALQGKRERVILATKAAAANLDRKAIVKACENSLRRLQTDYLDLYQIHWPNRELAPSVIGEGLEKLMEAGKIRAAGVCNYGTTDLQNLSRELSLSSNQMCYNLLFRSLEFELLPLCRQQGIGILCYSPLMMGLLTGKYQTPDDFAKTGRARSRLFSAKRGLNHGEPGFEEETFTAIDRIRELAEQLEITMPILSLAWLLHQPGITAVLAGARNPEQISQNLQSGELKLSSDTIQQLEQATSGLKIKMGKNLDPMRGRLESRIK